MKLRYENRKYGHNKFWEIELHGHGFTTTWGKIGTEGASTSKYFVDNHAAKLAHDAIIREKTDKGYALVQKYPLFGNLKRGVRFRLPYGNRPDSVFLKLDKRYDCERWAAVELSDGVLVYVDYGAATEPL